MKLKNRLRAGLLIAILLIGGGWLGVQGWHTAGLYRAVRGLQSLSDGALGRAEINQASGLVSDAARHARGLRWGAAPLFPVFDLLAWLPGAGKYLAQVEPLLLYGSGLADAGDRVLQGLAPLLEENADRGDAPLSQKLVAQLAENRAVILAAQDSVARAAAARQNLDLALLPGKLGESLRSLDRRFPLIQGGIGLLAGLPELAGAGTSRTYLVVAQNQDEIRATGGFISSFGLLEVSGGDIVRFEMQDSYAVDNFDAGYPPPPQPIAIYMLAGYWVPRDANWSPDFPSAAHQIQALYTASTGVSVDGVIAFDQSALVYLLDALGPVEVEAAGEMVGTQNVVAWMQRAWAPDAGEGATGEWWEQRKDFMGSLGMAMKDRLIGLADPGTMAKVGVTALQAMQAGHIMLHFNQPESQSALAQAGLDGAVRPGTGDFLMLVDSNLGFNKTDANIQRSIDYLVDLTDLDLPRARISVTYRNGAAPGIICKHAADYGVTYGNTYYDMQQRCYWDYWRVLAAGDSRLSASQAAAIPADALLTGMAYNGQVDQAAAEGGTTEFAGMMVLPAGQSQTVSLEWLLPRRVLEIESERIVYTLKVQKQPGIDRSALRLVVIAPVGMSLNEIDGWRMGDTASEWAWTGSLEETLEFRLVFSRRINTR